MPAERPMLKTNENRRSNKPIMEKRRRARINSCLNELKALILEALKKDPARHSKLEKADILEMTVKHLQNLQRQQIALQTASNPNVTNKFRAGYHECANEVSRYLRHMDGLDQGSQQRLLNHLSNCIEFLNRSEFKSVIRSTASTTQPLNIRVTSLLEAPIGQLTPLPTPNGMDKSSNNTLLPSVGFHLLPTRMANGEFALVLPAGAAANGTTAIPTCTVVRNRIQDANDRLNPGSNLLGVAPIISRAMMSPFCVSADENSLESGCPKSLLHAASSSPVDLCGGSAGREHRMVTSKEPWRPW